MLERNQQVLTGTSTRFDGPDVLALAGIGISVFSEIDLPGSLENLFD